MNWQTVFVQVEPHINTIVKRWPYQERADGWQEARIGVWQAVEKRSAAMDERQFWKYLNLRLRGQLTDYLRKTTPYSRSKGQAVLMEPLDAQPPTAPGTQPVTYKDLLEDERPTPEEEAEHNSQVRHLERCWKDLRGEHQRILRLLYWSGYSQPEAARLLGLSHGRISQLHTAALAELGRRMKQKRTRV